MLHDGHSREGKSNSFARSKNACRFGKKGEGGAFVEKKVWPPVGARGDISEGKKKGGFWGGGGWPTERRQKRRTKRERGLKVSKKSPTGGGGGGGGAAKRAKTGGKASKGSAFQRVNACSKNFGEIRVAGERGGGGAGDFSGAHEPASLIGPKGFNLTRELTPVEREARSSNPPSMPAVVPRKKKIKILQGKRQVTPNSLTMGGVTNPRQR